MAKSASKPPLVGIIMGSKSDWETLRHASETLDEIGVPHEVKGESVVCFCVLRPGHAPTDQLRGELIERVTQAMGKAIKPERVLFVRELPKTRSAKIMRRVIRAT